MSKKNQLTTMLLAIALVGSVLGATTVSLAQYDKEIHMGAECRVLTTPNGFSMTTKGHVENVNPFSYMQVICPLTRVDPDVAINEVRVAVQDQNNDADKYVSCQVTCYEDNDYTTSSSGTGYRDSDNSPNTTVGYDTIFISASDITEYNDGRCFLDCWLPDGDMSLYSEIVSYQADY